MIRLRTIAMCTVMVAVVLSACASSAVAVEFTTSYTDGASWNSIYAQGFKASVAPSPDPGHAATDMVGLDRFQFFKSGNVDSAVDIRLAILNNFFVNLDTLTTSSEELVGLSTNTIASTASIATGDPITFNFDSLPLVYGDPEEWGTDSYAAVFVNVDEGGAITPVLVSALVADYIEDPPGTWVPESDYGDVTGDYTLAVSNWYETDEYGTYFKTWAPYYADATFVAYFDMEATVLLGDYNNNGTVDAADYTVWRDAFEAGGTELLNDPTPGTVGETDYTYWKEHFGETSPGSGAGALVSAAVPEANTMALASIAALALLVSRRLGSRGIRD